LQREPSLGSRTGRKLKGSSRIDYVVRVLAWLFLPAFTASLVVEA
jgi:hypothetical protein